MSLTSEGIPMTMPVQPAGSSYGNSGGMGWGGDSAWWIIILFLFVFCGWGNGNGFGNGSSATQGALTRGDLCMDMSFQEVQNGVRNINDAVNLGFANLNSTICHQQYDTAMLIGNVASAVNGGFSALNSTICQQQYDTAAQLNAMNMANMQNTNAIQTQISGCCCDLREGISGVNYNLATQACDTRNTIQTSTRDLIDNQNANARAILDKLTSQEMAAKDAQISALNQQLFTAQLSASQAAQTAQIVNTLNPAPVPAYPASSPCGLGNWSPSVLANGYGYNNGCGCGCA